MLHQVNIYEADGIKHYSRLGSYLAWRSSTPDHKLPPVKLDDWGICTHCHGERYVYHASFGQMRCICAIWEEENYLRHTLADYRSQIVPRSLDELVEWGDYNNRRTLAQVKKNFVDWMKWPDTWITMIGFPGTGKTHIMSAMAGYFGAWALYVTASDFEVMLFDAMRTDTLGQMIEAMRVAPILLYDDLGSEYVREGKDFIRSNLRKIIDFRYLRWEEYPTVVATNLLDHNKATGAYELRMYDPRIADRILDQKFSRVFMLGPSWRTNGDSG